MANNKPNSRNTSAAKSSNASAGTKGKFSTSKNSKSNARSKGFNSQKSQKTSAGAAAPSSGKTDAVSLASAGTSLLVNAVQAFGRGGVLLEDALHVPYNNSLGTAILPAGVVNGIQDVLPGACTIFFSPTPGFTTTASSAVNQVSRQMKVFMTTNNARSSHYEAPDIAAVLVSYASIVQRIECLRRLYGCITNPSAFNLYRGIDFNAILGFEPITATSDNLAMLRNKINFLIQKVNQITVPADIGFINYWANMVKSVYLDAPTTRAQSYAFVPVVRYRYNTFRYNTGGCAAASGMISDTRLETLLPGNTIAYNIDSYALMIDNDIDAIINNTSLQYMYADFRAVWTDYFNVEPVLEGYVTPFIYDPATLDAIHNSRCYGFPVFQSQASVLWDVYAKTSSDGGLYMVQAAATGYYTGTDTQGSKGGQKTRLSSVPNFVDFSRDDITSTDVLSSLQFQSTTRQIDYVATPDNISAYEHTVYGLAILNAMRFWYKLQTDVGTDSQLKHYTYSNWDPPTTDLAKHLPVEVIMSRFNTLPFCCWWQDGLTTGSYLFMVGDADVFSTVDSVRFKSIWNAAILAAWFGPGLNNFNAPGLGLGTK